MASSSRFWILFLLLLSFPAVLYVSTGPDRSSGFGFLVPNYLYMAAPHLLVGLLAIGRRARGPLLLRMLTLLNVILLMFQGWVLTMPAHDGAHAWILYIPLWVLTLVVCGIAWVVVRYSGPAKTGGAT